LIDPAMSEDQHVALLAKMPDFQKDSIVWRRWESPPPRFWPKISGPKSLAQ
jgi:hypothetical protein